MVYSSTGLQTCFLFIASWIYPPRCHSHQKRKPDFFATNCSLCNSSNSNRTPVVRRGECTTKRGRHDFKRSRFNCFFSPPIRPIQPIIYISSTSYDPPRPTTSHRNEPLSYFCEPTCAGSVWSPLTTRSDKSIVSPTGIQLGETDSNMPGFLNL